jgi:hypothetical protein
LSTTSYDRPDRLTGWSMFAAIWLLVAGLFNVVDGLTAIHRSNQFSSQLLLFSHANFWGWVILIVGILQVVAAFMVFGRNPTGNVIGVSVATFSMFIWFFLLFVAPFGALVAVVVNGLVIYGLTVGSEG